MKLDNKNIDSFSYQKSMLLTLFLDSVTINHNFLLIVLLKLSFGLKTKTLSFKGSILVGKMLCASPTDELIKADLLIIVQIIQQLQSGGIRSDPNGNHERVLLLYLAKM